MSNQNKNHSPSIYDDVTEGVNFQYNGEDRVARGIIADADGTIDVIREDGTTKASKLVFKGNNVFRCIQVSSVNGLTLEWYE